LNYNKNIKTFTTNIFSKKFKISHIIITGFFILSALLSLYNLNQTYFWDDESQVGIIANNFLSTGNFTGWDGRNLYGYNNGSLLDKNLRIINPPLDYLVTAVSFSIFGSGTFPGRLPFVLAGLAALLLFIFLSYRVFNGNLIPWIFSVGFLALSVDFLLYIRQCRYYALTLLFSLLVVGLYIKLVSTNKCFYSILLSISAILLFYSNYFIALVFLSSLFINHFIFHWIKLQKISWSNLILALTIFLAATVPYSLYFHIWNRPDLIRNASFLELLFEHLKYINQTGLMPWLYAIAIFLVLLSKKNDNETINYLLKWTLFVCMYVIILSLLSPYPDCKIRNLIVLLPVFAIIHGYLLQFVYKYNKTGALLIFALLITTNIFTLSPINKQFSFSLPSYIKEITNPYPESCSQTVKYLEDNIQKDEKIFSYPFYMNYPIMFYLGDKIKICCNLNKTTNIPIEKLNDLNAPVFIEDNFPDWLISYSFDKDILNVIKYFERTHTENKKTIKYKYVLNRTLDVFWYPTQRPGTKHHFGPITAFDKKSQAVYIFKRSK